MKSCFLLFHRGNLRMEQEIKNKILLLEELVEMVKTLQGEGKVIVQSHGIFDLIHPGIITHLNEAKEQGDVLIVTVIKDKSVRKMPGRPVFPGEMRLENVASLAQVDYVCLVDDSPPFHCVELITPDIFAKGEDYLERDKLIHGEHTHSTENDVFSKSRIYETKGFSFSSSQIINSLLDIYPEKTKSYISLDYS